VVSALSRGLSDGFAATAPRFTQGG